MATDHLVAALALGVLTVLARASMAACVLQPPPDMVWVTGSRAPPGEGTAAAATPATHPAAGQAFWIGRHEVTNLEFTRFVEDTGYTTTAERAAPGGQRQGSFVFRQLQRLKLDSSWWRLERAANWRHPQGEGSNWARIADHPVVHVTLADALAYARWAGGTLPTEAQWEYAAGSGRAGTGPPVGNTWQGEFPVRDTAADGHAGSAPVGSYAPNALDLYDMLGNVWELTRSVDAAHRRTVIKGGSFLCNPRYCNSAHVQARQWQDISLSTSHVGFRLAALPCR